MKGISLLIIIAACASSARVAATSYSEQFVLDTLPLSIDLKETYGVDDNVYYDLLDVKFTRDGLTIDMGADGDDCGAFDICVTTKTRAQFPLDLSSCDISYSFDSATMNANQTFHMDAFTPTIFLALRTIRKPSASCVSRFVEFSGEYCPVDTYGQNCTHVGTTFPRTLEDGEQVDFMLTAPPNTALMSGVVINLRFLGRFHLGVVQGDVFRSIESPANLAYNLINSGGQPGPSTRQITIPATGRSSLNPRESIFISLQAVNGESTLYEFAATLQFCDGNTGGPDCAWHFTSLNKTESLGLPPYQGRWNYTSLIMPAEQRLSTSTFVAGSIQIGMEAIQSGEYDVFLRRGLVPNNTMYDWHYRVTTHGKPIMFHIPSGADLVPMSSTSYEEVWYIAVNIYRLRDVPLGISFVLWVESDCPDNCSNDGTCKDNECVCKDDTLVFPHYNCKPLPPAPPTPEPTLPFLWRPFPGSSLTPVGAAFIVLAVLFIIGAIMIGIFVYYHRRHEAARRQYRERFAERERQRDLEEQEEHAEVMQMGDLRYADKEPLHQEESDDELDPATAQPRTDLQ